MQVRGGGPAGPPPRRDTRKSLGTAHLRSERPAECAVGAYAGPLFRPAPAKAHSLHRHRTGRAPLAVCVRRQARARDVETHTHGARGRSGRGSRVAHGRERGSAVAALAHSEESIEPSTNSRARTGACKRCCGPRRCLVAARQAQRRCSAARSCPAGRERATQPASQPPVPPPDTHAAWRRNPAIHAKSALARGGLSLNAADTLAGVRAPRRLPALQGQQKARSRRASRDHRRTTRRCAPRTPAVHPPARERRTRVSCTPARQQRQKAPQEMHGASTPAGRERTSRPSCLMVVRALLS